MTEYKLRKMLQSMKSRVSNYYMWTIYVVEQKMKETCQWGDSCICIHVYLCIHGDEGFDYECLNRGER